MDTPIYDFLLRYREEERLRLHMPGHKGVGPLGIESLDLTEVEGADALYAASGIIKESEENASRLFGCPTYYTTEGSSHAIRAMLYLVTLYARMRGKKARILAGRNAHKAFLSAAVLLDFSIEWLYPEKNEDHLSALIDREALLRCFENGGCRPDALYLTTPDYLGRCESIRDIAALCKKYGVLLLVDNAHGAYRRFLPVPSDPISLGADMAASSAHKTLPALTGAAYLHIADGAPALFKSEAKNALLLFGSTSPSYLTLASLDLLNRYLADGYREKLCQYATILDKCKLELTKIGFSLYGDEPLKITLAPKPFGYTGDEVADYLRKSSIECEASDKDHTVLMFTPEARESAPARLLSLLKNLQKRMPIQETPPPAPRADAILSLREAMLSPSETVTVSDAVGRILRDAAISCPPAVPILVAGERVTAEAAEALSYYGIRTVDVVKEEL